MLSSKMSQISSRMILLLWQSPLPCRITYGNIWCVFILLQGIHRSTVMCSRSLILKMKGKKHKTNPDVAAPLNLPISLSKTHKAQ
ncbi:hypothetical protein C8R42DRAFT_238989 [Lentinula raphanica]|nr:hypothetical protein C8R42DRAFT_238989 [Lentinula raphanica]